MIQVIGYLRFSYPGRSDAAKSRDLDQDALRAYLYDPLRMAQRFHFFENICLPSLDAQFDQDFTLLVLIGDDMPPKYRAQMEQALEGRPYARLIADGNGVLNDAFNPVAEEIKDPNAKMVVHFRLDDDDAIARHVIRDLKKMAQVCREPTLLSMSRGIMLLELEGEVHFVEEIRPYIAIGWALALPPDVVRNAYEASHLRVANTMPSMVDPRKYSYIHTVHEGSDSKQGSANRVRNLIERSPVQPGTNTYRKMMATLGREFPCFSEEYLKDVRGNLPETLDDIGSDDDTAISKSA
ncbi:MAG: glycosyltransferase [Pseudomonadota bacterium]